MSLPKTNRRKSSRPKESGRSAAKRRKSSQRSGRDGGKKYAEANGRKAKRSSRQGSQSRKKRPAAERGGVLTTGGIYRGQADEAYVSRPSGTMPLVVGLIIGAAFAGGIVFGRTNGPDEQLVSNVDSILADADQSAERYRTMKEKLRLTFHDGLKEKAEIVPIAIPASPLEQPSDKMAAKKAAKVAASKRSDATKAHPPQKNAAPDKPVQTSASLLQDAIRRRVAASVPAKKTAKAASNASASGSVASAGGRHYVQVASFPSQAAADKTISRLDAEGIKASVSSVALSGGRTAFRVVTSSLPSKTQAVQMKDKIAARLGMTGLVRAKR